jgi:hypothetical protein
MDIKHNIQKQDTHNSTLHVLQRIALGPIALGPAPPRADPELSTVGI